MPSDGPEVAVLAGARAQLARAKTELAGFRARSALAAVSTAEADLLTVMPGAAQTTLLAELAFFAGRVHLREQNRGLARSSFELALRLAPDFPSPDPRRFNPDIVSTFKEARKNSKTARGATLEINTTYDGAEIYVNGAAVGPTPLAVSVSPGLHYIWAVSTEHRIVATRVDVGAGDSREVKIELVSLPVQDIGLRFRTRALEAKAARGGTPLSSLAAEVHALTGAESVLIVRGSAGNLEVSAFRAGRKRGTRFRSLDEGSANMLALLSPVRTLRPDQLFNAAPKPIKWYARSEVLAGAVGVGVSLIAVSVFAIAASDDTPGRRTALPGGFPR